MCGVYAEAPTHTPKESSRRLFTGVCSSATKMHANEVKSQVEQQGKRGPHSDSLSTAEHKYGTA